MGLGGGARGAVVVEAVPEAMVVLTSPAASDGASGIQVSMVLTKGRREQVLADVPILGGDGWRVSLSGF